MRTGTNTGSAPDTLVEIQADMIFVTAVVTKPCRAVAGTFVALDAFFSVNVDDVGKFFHGKAQDFCSKGIDGTESAPGYNTLAYTMIIIDNSPMVFGNKY